MPCSVKSEQQLTWAPFKITSEKTAPMWKLHREKTRQKRWIQIWIFFRQEAILKWQVNSPRFQLVSPCGSSKVLFYLAPCRPAEKLIPTSPWHLSMICTSCSASLNLTPQTVCNCSFRHSSRLTFKQIVILFVCISGRQLRNLLKPRWKQLQLKQRWKHHNQTQMTQTTQTIQNQATNRVKGPQLKPPRLLSPQGGRRLKRQPTSQSQRKAPQWKRRPVQVRPSGGDGGQSHVTLCGEATPGACGLMYLVIKLGKSTTFLVENTLLEEHLSRSQTTFQTNAQSDTGFKTINHAAAQERQQSDGKKTVFLDPVFCCIRFLHCSSFGCNRWALGGGFSLLSLLQDLQAGE